MPPPSPNPTTGRSRVNVPTGRPAESPDGTETWERTPCGHETDTTIKLNSRYIMGHDRELGEAMAALRPNSSHLVNSNLIARILRKLLALNAVFYLLLTNKFTTLYVLLLYYTILRTISNTTTIDRVIPTLITIQQPQHTEDDEAEPRDLFDRRRLQCMYTKP